MLRLLAIYFVLFGYSLGAVFAERLRGRNLIVPTVFDAGLVLAGMIVLGVGLSRLSGRPLWVLLAALSAGLVIHLLRPGSELKAQPQ